MKKKERAEIIAHLQRGCPSYESEDWAQDLCKSQKERILDIFSHNDDDKCFIDVIEMMNGCDWQRPFIVGNYLAASPGQGWKLHVSARDREDYVDIIRKLLPVFNDLNVKYKVVGPGLVGRMPGTQAGKYITVYLGEEEAVKKFLAAIPPDTLTSLLANGALPVPGEIHVGGRMYARYGSFIEDYILDPHGRLVPDDRGVACPEWVNPLSVAF